MTTPKDQLPEIQDLLSWLGTPPRSPLQTHGINESDSEILDLGNGTFLATTLDSISEEIEAGLYQDPYTMGWVVAMASLSDLAAVGARPLGMLLSTEWDRGFTIEKKRRMAQGFSDALARCGTFLLGGDTGNTRSTVLSGVAMGLCDSRPLSRIGIQTGDWVCITGKIGNGPALALRLLRGDPETHFVESQYRPVARIPEGIALRTVASACMDTSDGLLSTLDTLRILNGINLELYWNPELFASSATQYLNSIQVPHWLLWAIEHGDYELVVTIPKEKIDLAKTLVPNLIILGRVIQGNKTTLKYPDSSSAELDLSLIRSLTRSNSTDLKLALTQLIQYASSQRFP